MSSDLGFGCPSCRWPMGESKAIPLIAVGGFLNAIWHCRTKECNVTSVMVAIRPSCGEKGEECDTTTPEAT